MNIYQSLIQPERDVSDYIQHTVRQEECFTGLDIGCGRFSNLTALRPQLVSTGIDSFAPAIEEAKSRNLHDHYIVDDVMRHNFAGEKFDVVVANEVIEHLDKLAGWELLKRLESLSGKLVVITTPNGFLPQGAEFGNPWQRHKSGWFVHDFIGLGYLVRGFYGPKFMRGYAGQMKWRGSRVLTPLSQVLGMMLGPWPHLHFGLLAIKDVRDVSVRLASGSRATTAEKP